MKKLLILVAATILAGCSTPDIDWSYADRQCSMHCSDAYNECLASNPLTPGIQKLNCNSSLKLCASTCGGKVM
jgi:uncharacterized lipoprotein YmbA